MNRGALTIAAAMALAGCGSHNTVAPDGSGGTTITQSDGNGGTMTAHLSGDDAAPLPGDLPKWAPAFPNAKVEQVMVQNDKSTSIKTVALSTGQDMKTVVGFYNTKIAAAGITPTMAQDTPDGAVRVVEGTSGVKDMLMIGRNDDRTTITLAYNPKR